MAPFDTDVDIPSGTVIVTADGTESTTLLHDIPAGQTGITQLAVSEAAFAASISPGDSLTLLLPTLTLGIEPYQPELQFPSGSLVATLDNRVRLPLLIAMPAGQPATSLRLQYFASGDQLSPLGSQDGESISVESVEPVYDAVDLEPNFLVYSGPHQITMVEE